MFFNGQAVEHIALGSDRRRLNFKSDNSAQKRWYHVRAEGAAGDRFPLDTSYPQGFTNPVWVTVGITDSHRASAEYSLRWIDRLKLAEACEEAFVERKSHVYASLTKQQDLPALRNGGSGISKISS